MTDWDLVADLAAALGVPAVGRRRTGMDALLPLLDRVRQDGATFLVKLDADRGTKPYTAVVSRSPFDDWVTRRDAATLEESVVFVLARYSEHRRAQHTTMS